MARIPKRLSPGVAFAVGAILFLALGYGSRPLASVFGLEGMAAHQVLLKSMMLALSIALMWLVGRPRRVWGFASPRAWPTSTLVPMVVGGGLGVLATGTILGLGLPPMAGLGEMGLLKIIPIIWFGSTIAEEVFVRGLIQGWMQPIEGAEGALMPPGAPGRILASGLLFGSMHLTLFLMDNDPRTVGVIVTATTLLGLVCAWSRERSGSLAGPLLSHFAFNACGLIGGMLVVAARLLLSS